MLSILYAESVPKNAQAAIGKAIWFLNGGKDSDKDDPAAPRVYSFSKDADFIFAAFRQTHGIDLQAVEMHWWKFLALFMDLGHETTFCQLTALRKRVKTGKATKEEKQAAKEMGDLFDVPEIDTRTLAEKEFEIDFQKQYEEAKKRRDAEKEKRKSQP